jgi:hypothetical protein
VKIVRALLGGALAVAAAVTVQVATAPSASAEASTQCVHCWHIIIGN